MKNDRYFALCPQCGERSNLPLAAKLRAAWQLPTLECECGNVWQVYPEQMIRADEAAEAVTARRADIPPPHYVQQPMMLPTYQPPRW